eukprot:6021070-Prymnesium_polylepis.1
MPPLSERKPNVPTIRLERTWDTPPLIRAAHPACDSVTPTRARAPVPGAGTGAARVLCRT